MDRPPPDPRALRSIWMEFENGETMPGMVLSRLKTAGMRDLLDTLAEQAEQLAQAEAGSAAPNA